MMISVFVGVALSAAIPAISGTATVIDGDTIEIHDRRIRLHGIDAAESGQPCTKKDGSTWRCGQSAALALADRIGRAPVQCEPRDVDRYNRVVAICFLGDVDLNGWMVSEGWAVAYRRYSLDYVTQEDQARKAGRGMWGSDFAMPWDWRKRRSEAAGDGGDTHQRLMRLARGGYSCSPRKTCKAIGSCEEARWLLANCPWGDKLDRDNDGVPCESIC